MPSINKFVLLEILVSSGAFSCFKAPKYSPVAIVPYYNCTCTVNNTSWSADATASIDTGFMTITGIQASDGQMITMTLNSTDVGEYDLYNGIGNNAVYKPDSKPNTQEYVLDGSALARGKILITVNDTVNKTVSGTFFFLLEKRGTNLQVGIDNGVFTKVPYTGLFQNTVNSLSANVNDTSWVARSVYKISSGNTIGIAASKNDGSTLILYFPSDITPRTYSFNPLNNGWVAQFNKFRNAFYQGQSGSVTFTTTTSGKIIGNFSFKAINPAYATDSVNINKGSFDINF